MPRKINQGKFKPYMPSGNKNTFIFSGNGASDVDVANSDQVTNNSNVVGSNVTEALNSLISNGVRGIVYNDTGSDLTKGKIVYPSGVHASGLATADLADSSEYDKCRFVAMVEETIPNGESGYIVLGGRVSGLNTSGLSVGAVYLKNDGSGDLTNTRPTGGSYIVLVGFLLNVDASDGVVVIDRTISELSVEVTDTNGFPIGQRDNTTLAFDDETRTFSISPDLTQFHFYQTGIKYIKTTTQNLVITDVTGQHIIYFDDGVLTAIANPTIAQVSDIILNRTIVSIVYWNATDSKSVLFWDERHGISMAPATHEVLHNALGSQYISGLDISGIVIDDGSSNTHAQFGNTAGVTQDEDLKINITTTASTVGFTYLYKSGASGDWASGFNSGYSFPVGATPLPQFNEYTGATYQLTEVTSGNYLLLHIFGSNNNDLKPVVVIGDSQYSTVLNATNGIDDELNRVLDGLPLPEFVPLATVIIEGKTSFTNSVNARVVQNSDGEDYRDHRT